MAENPALARHKKLTEQILWLQKEIQASTAGSIDASESDFKYKQFVQNWNKKTGSYKSLSTGNSKRKDITNMLRVLSRGLKTAGGLDTSLLMDAQNIDPRYNPRDPKSVYKFLVNELQRTEKYLGARTIKDRGSLPGISGDGAGKLLRLGDLNDRYVRKFDSKIIKANEKISERTRADYLRGTDQNAPGFDPEGWRLELPEGHPDRTFRAYDDVGAKTVTVKGTQFPETGTIRESLKVNKPANNNNNKSNLGIGSRWEGNTLYGGGGFIGRNTDVRMSDGGSTVFTKAAADFLHIKKGEHLGVLTARQRQMYDDLYINPKR